MLVEMSQLQGPDFPGSRPSFPGKREGKKSGNSRDFLVPGIPADSTSYGPKRDGASHRGSRRSSRFPPNFTKTTMARSTVQVSAQFKKGVSPHIISQVLGLKYPNLGENWRTGGAPKWREKSKKLFFSSFLTHNSLPRAANCSKITLPGGHSSH